MLTLQIGYVIETNIITLSVKFSLQYISDLTYPGKPGTTCKQTSSRTFTAVAEKPTFSQIPDCFHCGRSLGFNV